MRKRSASAAAVNTPSFQRLFDGNEPKQCAAQRQDAYQQCWQKIDQTFKVNMAICAFEESSH